MSTLLIVDDERTIREGIASAIDWAALGITRVFQAPNGKKAHQIISAEKPDIVIVDILMPEMTGMELIALCRKAPDCPEFVIISGHDEFKYAQEALRHHVFNYILKPCDAAEIADTVGKILQELKKRRSMEEDSRELRERLETLIPQARERILNDYLRGAPIDAPLLAGLRDSLGRDPDRFLILLLFAGEQEKRRALPELKTEADSEAERELGGRPLSTILRDSLILLFPADMRSKVDGFLSGLRGRDGLRAVLSAPGGFEALPQLFLVAHRTAERAFLMKDPAGLASVLEVSGGAHSAAIQKTMRHIEEHYADNALTLGKTAKEVLRMNADYLGKLFKKECGMSFGEYLMAVRVEKAKLIMAASDDVRIYEAAWQVGFGDDAAYFGQVFRKHTGRTPGEYRKNPGT